MSNPQSFADKVIWVTGAGRGLGRAIAEFLADRGATIYATARSSDQVGDLAAAYPAETIRPAPGSVCSSEDIADVVGQIVGAGRGLDGLVNCAGISPSFGRSERVTREVFEQILATNVGGTFLCTQAAAQVMLSQPTGGSIVSISSVHASVGFPRLAPYAASKGAVEAMTKSLAVEWADRAVRVNCVAPGYFRTELSERLLDGDWGKEVLRRTPMGRIGDLADVAAAAAYLLGDESKYVTGTTLTVDGGWKAW